MRLLLAIALVSWGSLVLAEDSGTRLAAYETLGVPRPDKVVTFHKRITERGDRVDQQVNVSLSMDSTIRQADKEVVKTSNTMQRKQHRTIIVERVVESRTVAAQVRFGECQRTVDGETERPSIAGQIYRCQRQEDDVLHVARADGSLPTPDEFAQVTNSMGALGRPNPLADYLAGKSVHTGDTLQVPNEVGEALLSGDDAWGRVSKFELTLKSVDPVTKVASFAIEILSEGAETTQMKLMVHGTLEVETDTCRTRLLKFSGPLAMATTLGSYSSQQTMFVSGRLQLEMTASYVD